MSTFFNARWLVAVLALLAIVGAAWKLEAASTGLQIEARHVGAMPATVFRPAGGGPAPVVLVAHGFAGSQQLMQPFAVTLARSGFIAVTFDFPGHGRHPLPMRGGLADQDESLRTLLAAMDEMGRFASGLAADGRYAVVGHSMASDIVVRHAQAQSAVQATVAVSLFAPSIRSGVAADRPRNLLVVAGALEPGVMAREALRVLGSGSAVDATYGRFDDGSARRATLSPGVEHIGVLYSAHTLAESRRWLQAAFGQPVGAGDAFVDARGPALGLLLAGVLGLAWPLAAALPRVATAAPALRRRWWGRRGQAAACVLPAIATPLLLWKLPTDVLPVLLGDYLVLHFALYGALTLVALWWLGERPRPLSRRQAGALVVAVLCASVYAVLAVGVPVDRWVFNVQPVAVRLPVVAALCAGTLVYFIADEALSRGPAAARGAYLASKACFLVSLVLAIALNPQRLFFLAIIVPAILLLFVIYGLFSRWAYRRTGHPAVAAVANALAFGSFIAVTFPLVA